MHQNDIKKECGCNYECTCPTVDDFITEDKKIKDDNVDHPKHYTDHPSGIECIQITEHMGSI